MPDTLLLADDSATIQRVIEMTFADEDVQVVAVGDGREAIERIAADPPDIVLADTNMPEKDGYDVSAFVKADRALSHIPVVLLTGAFDPVDGERAREVGCDAVLVKPFEPKAVISRVRELLGAPPEAGAAPAVAAAASSTAEQDAAAGDGGPEPAGEAAEPESAAPAAPAPAEADAPAAPDVSSAAPDASPAAPDAAPAAGKTWPAAEGAPPAAEDAHTDTWAQDPDTGAPPAAEDASPTVEGASPAAEDAPPAEDASSAPAEGAGAAGAAPPAVPAVEAPAPPTLADAFASLLAAEQGDLDRARTAYPWPRQAAPAGEEDLVERVAERVVERLSDEVTDELVSEVVARVAERLVRDQIGRVRPD